MKSLPRASLACAILLLACGTICSQESTSLLPIDPETAYRGRMSDPVTYQVDFSAVVTPPYHAKVLKIWMPMPQSDAIQTVTEGEFSTFPMKVEPKIGVEKVYGNKFAYFEFDHPEGAQIVRHKFTIKTHEVHWDVDPAKVIQVKEWPASFAPFLRNDEKQAVVVNDDIRKTVRQIVPAPSGEGKDLQSVFAWVAGTLKYDHAKASLQASSVNAITQLEGHCSDYHGLCSAMGRALGYPTRMTYGMNPFPKNSPSHCKMEAFLPPYGWVPFDVSETQNMMNAIKKNAELDPGTKEKLVKAVQDRLFKGFRDNTWFLQTRGSDYDLEPPAARKVAVVRTIYAEADGVALPEPDPANREQTKFAWMTVHDFHADRAVTYPYKDLKSLTP